MRQIDLHILASEPNHVSRQRFIFAVHVLSCDGKQRPSGAEIKAYRGNI